VATTTIETALYETQLQLPFIEDGRCRRSLRLDGCFSPDIENDLILLDDITAVVLSVAQQLDADVFYFVVESFPKLSKLAVNRSPSWM